MDDLYNLLKQGMDELSTMSDEEVKRAKEEAQKFKREHPNWADLIHSVREQGGSLFDQFTDEYISDVIEGSIEGMILAKLKNQKAEVSHE